MFACTSKKKQEIKRLLFLGDSLLIGNCDIIPLYDAPHLLKGIRNNLLTKYLAFKETEDGCIILYRSYHSLE